MSRLLVAVVAIAAYTLCVVLWLIFCAKPQPRDDAAMNHRR